MVHLPSYKNFKQKNNYFRQDGQFLYINTIHEFDEWYANTQRHIKVEKGKKQKSKIESININHMFRGMGEAKYKLLTSAQRFWIKNNLENLWKPKKYLEFVQKFVDSARKELLFNKVFQYYRLTPNQRDFPILSILQHYHAPTPLMDWTYNLDVALYFAIYKHVPIPQNEGTSKIDEYVSIYHINKKEQKWNNFINLLDFTRGSFPRISSFYSWEHSHNLIFYISDFEDKRIPTRSFTDERPITTFYNLNIIPQQGLFIFNPFPTKPLEDCFNTANSIIKGKDLELFPFNCINIRKELANHIFSKIQIKGIDKNFIYPNLSSYCEKLTEHFSTQITH